MQPFYIGGVRDYGVVATGSGVTSGLEGAIQKLIVNGLEIDDIRGGVTDMVNIPSYYGKPTSGRHHRHGQHPIILR